jgi:hypothetical protein
MDTSSKFFWLFTNEHEQVLKKLGSWSAPGQYKNKNKNVLLPIKGPQGANNLIQWLKWLETYM